MKHRKSSVAAAWAAAGTLATGAVLAAPMGNLPPEQTQGTVMYRSGGIGSAEAAAMRHAESGYPLSIEFVRRAKPNDELLAGVRVTIKDATGNTALQATSAGPFLLAKLPDGKYTVTAEAHGKTETRHVTVAAAKPDHLVFAW